MSEIYDKIYDIKDEFKHILNINYCDSNIKKYIKYKNYKGDKNGKYDIDCDSSKYATEIYRKKWTFLNGVKKATKQYKKIDKNRYYIREYKYQLILNKNNKKEYYRGDTMTSFTNIFKHYEKNFLNDNEIHDLIEILAALYHCIGNMIPVPSGFNINRSGNRGIHDYWDITMLKVKDWYDSGKKDDKILLDLLHSNKEAFYTCREWLLNNFDSWRCFVDKNYLRSFVDEEYNVIIFWKQHSWENYKLPKERDEFKRFLKLLIKCISNRYTEIVEM